MTRKEILDQAYERMRVLAEASTIVTSDNLPSVVAEMFNVLRLAFAYLQELEDERCATEGSTKTAT